MLLQEEPVQTLVKLGLTVLQAKVYLSLVKLGTSTGRTTAKAAKVAPQDVYRVLTELEEKGLIEKLIAKPNKYRPIPLEKGLSMLLQRRNKQTIELKKATFEVFNAFQSIDNFEEQNETGDFVLIPNGKPIENRVARVWETAKTNISLMNDFQEGMDWHEKEFGLEVKALKKGINVREILSKTQKNYRTRKSFWLLMNSKSGYQVRYLYVPSPAKLMIKDNKEVFISTTRKINSSDYPGLWSNNQILVQLIQEWFDNMWERAENAKGTIETQKANKAKA